MEIEENQELTLNQRLKALMDYGITKPLTLINSIKKFHDVGKSTIYTKINLIK